MYKPWNVKLRSDSTNKVILTVTVYAVNRDQARKRALDVAAPKIGSFFGYAACEASVNKTLMSQSELCKAYSSHLSKP